MRSCKQSGSDESTAKQTKPDVLADWRKARDATPKRLCVHIDLPDAGDALARRVEELEQALMQKHAVNLIEAEKEIDRLTERAEAAEQAYREVKESHDEYERNWVDMKREAGQRAASAEQRAEDLEAELSDRKDDLEFMYKRAETAAQERAQLKKQLQTAQKSLDVGVQELQRMRGERDRLAADEIDLREQVVRLTAQLAERED